MKVRLWGTRGSLAAPGPDTIRYGGNTSCVQVTGPEGTVLVLDAGTGIRRVGALLGDTPRRVDILLTHLHMDHIQGLGFFAPLRRPGWEVHIWGPGSTTLGLRARLSHLGPGQHHTRPARAAQPLPFPAHLSGAAARAGLRPAPARSALRRL
jgi:phosphoribosyl 1,2-cyclic phosphodiesterase